MIWVLGLIVGLLVAVGFVIRDTAVADTPVPTNPNFIDQIIASHAVLVSIRLALIFAAGYIVLSVIMLIARRQWINKIGWVEVTERQVAASSELAEENDELYEILRGVADENDVLKEQLQQADTLIDALLEDDYGFEEEAGTND